MKVMVGQFKTESNANVPLRNHIGRYDIGFGEECIRKLQVQQVFEKEGIEMIPAIYCDTGPSYVLTRETFDYIESCFINCLKQHLHEIDGIYLMLHGGSYVDEIGSGDFHILNEIRKITGPYLPIAIACDPHGNLCKEYVDQCTIIRSYRESPHIDSEATKKHVAKLLCELLKNRQNIHPIYRKLPLILGGEQSVSFDEPVKSFNQYMDEMEKDPSIMSVSWHVGYLRHDCYEAGCGIVVVPSSEKDHSYCEKRADEFAKYIWDKRHEFHYTGLSLKPDEAMDSALKFEGKPVFITDSGDNSGSGGPGWNTIILRQALEAHSCKSFLFAGIHHNDSFNLLNDKKIGTKVHIKLGEEYDENSTSVKLEVTILAKGPIKGAMMHDRNADFGQCVTVHIENSNIDVMIQNSNFGFCEEHQFKAAGVNWDDYDVIVIKQGYIQPECKEKAALDIMSLTAGPTLQDTTILPFKRIMRPMFPLDDM